MPRGFNWLPQELATWVIQQSGGEAAEAGASAGLAGCSTATAAANSYASSTSTDRRGAACGVACCQQLRYQGLSPLLDHLQQQRHANSTRIFTAH